MFVRYLISIQARRKIDEICLLVRAVVGPKVLKKAHRRERPNISSICTHGKKNAES